MKYTIQTKTKCILIGEYALFFNKPAIVFPINQLITIEISDNKESLQIISENKQIQKFENYIKSLIKLILKELKEKEQNWTIKIKCTIPIQTGIGTSASIAIGLIKAIYKILNLKLTKKNLFKLATKLENLSHGKASGIDHSTIVFDEMVMFYQNNFNKKLKKVPESNLYYEKIKNWTQTTIIKNLYLLYTGTPEESTKEMVEIMLKKNKENPKKINSYFKSLELLTYKLKENFLKDQKIKFQNNLNKAGEIYEKLQITSKFTNSISKTLREENIANKITGAGGEKNKSGMILVYCEQNNYKKLQEISKRNKLKIFNIFS